MMREQWLVYLVEKLKQRRSFWRAAVLQNQMGYFQAPPGEAFLDPELGVLLRACASPFIAFKVQLCFPVDVL